MTTCDLCRLTGECAKHEFIRLRTEADLRERGELVPTDPLEAMSARLRESDRVAREQRDRLDLDIAVFEKTIDMRAERMMPSYRTSWSMSIF